jgi:hypothetical protein
MSPTLSSSFKPAPFQRNTIQDPLGANDADLSPSRQIDMDRLADGLQKLGEDDLLVVVQMVHDNKSAESYTKNDVERTSIFLSFFPSFFLSSNSPFKTIYGSSLANHIRPTKQKASSTWTCTPSPTTSSRCYGTLCWTRTLSKAATGLSSFPPAYLILPLS